MKPRKLTNRLILVLIVLGVAFYYLYPTFRYHRLRRWVEHQAMELAQQMGASFPFVIEGLNREDPILADYVQSRRDINEEERRQIQARIEQIQKVVHTQLSKYRKKAVKQGLDLQGGMHLVLEVDIVQLLRNMARQRDPRLEKILSEIRAVLDRDPQVDFNDLIVRAFQQEGLKLSQYFGEPGESDATVLNTLSKAAEDAINRSLEIIRNRIDQFGVSEPTIAKQGQRRIVLELPGIQDPNRARDLIGRTALLEFKLLLDNDKVDAILKNIDKALTANASETTSPSAGDTVTAKISSDTVVNLAEQMGTETTPRPLDTAIVRAEEGTLTLTSLLRGLRGDIAVAREDVRRVRALLSDPRVANAIPPGVQFLWSAKPEMASDGKEYYLLYVVKSDPELTGNYLSDARVTIGGGGDNFNRAGAPIVNLTLNRQGARIFSRVTGANVGKRLAIVLDEKVYMAPVIRTKIPDGRAIIEGSENVEEANDIAIVLRAGALPTSVVIEEERTVGPSLGRDSIRKGTNSALLGGLLVVLFMLIYYQLSGAIANLALLINIFLIFAGLAIFGAAGLGATLTLPGIAGIALTIGMAVDANVLIFERIREELETGKSVWHAIDSGYSRAFVTILDANVTTLIATLVLLQFGAGPIRGFAVTLTVGLIANLFAAVFVTRLIFDWIASRKTLTRLSI